MKLVSLMCDKNLLHLLENIGRVNSSLNMRLECQGPRGFCGVSNVSEQAAQ